MQKYIRIDNRDNVAVALEDLHKGDTLTIESENITLLDDVVRGHKIALCDISKDENVIKYGFPIGHAKELIHKGSHVHTHNVLIRRKSP